jgi:LysM repeat protein
MALRERLEKLRVRNLDTGALFFVLFNPTEYSIEDASRWADQDKMGQKPELHYTGGVRKKLSMELFFDTYEARSDVRQHTTQISGLLVFDKERHRPPKVELSWGPAAPGGAHAEFPFVCVLETLKQQFLLFLGDGTPVRAKLTVSFLEFTLPEEELQKNEPHSPDLTKLYVVKVRDTLSAISSAFYQDPTHWREIARANGITQPRDLASGQVLRIPKIV